MKFFNVVGILYLVFILTSCGGGGGTVSETTTNGNASSNNTVNNTLPITIDTGPLPNTNPRNNVPYVSVTICSPGTSKCQTIDHIIIDTGSTGLRIISSVLNTNISLTQNTLNNIPLGECLSFVSSYTWGSVQSADVQLGSEGVIHAMAIQVIGDPNLPKTPTNCSSNGGRATNTVDTFGANGILGVSVFKQDCGSACASSANNNVYFICPQTKDCTPVAVPISNQILNPVSLLAQDNNGLIVKIPSVSTQGSLATTGTLTFGIGTQSNNRMSGTNIYPLDRMASLTTIYTDLTNTAQTLRGFFDTGSNGIFFPDSGISKCTPNSPAFGFYCPLTDITLRASNQALNGAIPVTFTVGNADSLITSPNVAFNNLAGPAVANGDFDWGLPFFFSRTVYEAFEGASISGTNGPFVAF